MLLLSYFCKTQLPGRLFALSDVWDAAVFMAHTHTRRCPVPCWMRLSESAGRVTPRAGWQHCCPLAGALGGEERRGSHTQDGNWPGGRRKRFCSHAPLSWDPTWSTAFSSSAPNVRRMSTCLSKEGMKMVRWLEHLYCEDRLRELGLLGLEKRGHWGDFIAAF